MKAYPPDDLDPRPSAAVEYMRLIAEAWIATAPRDEAVRFLSALGERIAAARDEAQVIRLSTRAVEELRAHREAVAAIARDLPGFVAQLRETGT